MGNDDDKEIQSGIVKMGMFLSKYLEGVPNSKIFKLSKAIYESLSSDFKDILDDQKSVIRELDPQGVQELHQALTKKDYARVREIVKNSLDFEASPSPETREVPEEVFSTMKQDANHQYFAGEKVALKRPDGRILFGEIFLVITDRAFVSFVDGTDFMVLSQKLSDLWHF